MANYIKQSLEEGEEIIFNGKLHWSAIWDFIAWTILLIAGGIVAAWAAYYIQQDVWYYVAAALVAIGLLVSLWGHVERTRSEFAITNTRFIQKDGIFNIKMTEIPLFKIETVNFYQTIWQRMLATGCLELVGSGGTSHQVHSIEHPMQVRKIICSAINKNVAANKEEQIQS